jgi:CubicO group peptidase (beta-lactamase class C family)
VSGILKPPKATQSHHKATLPVQKGERPCARQRFVLFFDKFLLGSGQLRFYFLTALQPAAEYARRGIEYGFPRSGYLPPGRARSDRTAGGHRRYCLPGRGFLAILASLGAILFALSQTVLGAAVFVSTSRELRAPAETAGYHAPAASASPVKGYFPPPDAEGGWRSLTTAEDIRRVGGMDKRKLDEAFNLAEGSSTNGGLLVLRKGWLVYERYLGRGHREALCNLASCGKSYTSIAVGMLMAERPELFSDGLDQRIFTPVYLPAEAFPLTDTAKADIKLGQLLCFSAGIRGNNPCYVNGEPVRIEPIGPDGYKAMIDAVALGKQGMTNRGELVSAKTLWCKPGGGYSYATASAHLASMMVRHVTGMELEEYLRTRLAQPLGWGRFTYAYKQYPAVDHSPGGGGIAVRPTDVLRFGYLLLREGRWEDRQVVPADYVRQCGRKSPYNPHYPYSLQFNVNTDGQLADLPRDLYFKGGAGGHVLWIVPSLDLVVWRLAGRDDQYGEADTGVPLLPKTLKASESRKNWKPTVSRSIAEDQLIRKVIESVVEPSQAGEKKEQALSLEPASPPLPERASVAAVPFASGRLWQPDEAWVQAGHKPLPTLREIEQMATNSTGHQ